jgi:hypothetical protein
LRSRCDRCIHPRCPGVQDDQDGGEGSVVSIIRIRTCRKSKAPEMGLFIWTT